MNRKPIGLSVPYRKAGVVIDKSAAKRIATTIGWEPKREWVGLTDKDVVDLCKAFMGQFDKTEFIKAIERKLKEKNT